MGGWGVGGWGSRNGFIVADGDLKYQLSDVLLLKLSPFAKGT